MGSIGRRHAKNAIALGHDVQWNDANSETRFEHERAEWSSVRSMDADAILICTPASTHADVARALLGWGWDGPLFVEKPLALSVAECEVFRTWPNVVQMCGYNWRFNIEAKAFWEMNRDAYDIALYCATEMKSWPGRDYAAPLFECSHEIDLALWWLGGDVATETQMFSDWAQAHFKASKGSQTAYVSVQWDDPDPRRRFIARHKDRPIPYLDLRPEWIDVSYVDELAHFLACVETNEPTITPFADGIRVVSVCEDAMKAANA